jgi:radical SAM superfamily enzyme YgiQ (UPF0313 family)
MRIELINLPFSTEMHRRLDPPLYLLQLAPILMDEGFKVRVNDLNGVEPSCWTFGHCLIYVIYIDNRSYDNSKLVAAKCKQLNPQAVIVACGSGPSKHAVKYVKSQEFDVVIRGEAESAILTFINDSLLRVNGSFKELYQSEVDNINRLPLPIRSLVEMNTYSRKLSGERAAMIMGSRGSPFRSTWLCKGLKTFSTTRIINEIDGIVSEYGIKGFLFGDECFTYDRVRATNIAKVMAERGLRFSFNDDIQNVNIPLYRTLHDLGAREVVLNSYSSKDIEFGRSMQSKVERETGIKAVLKKESKYREQAHRAS